MKVIPLPGIFSSILLLTWSWKAHGENFEFQLTNPMLITSLRTFEPTSESFYVFKQINGSVILKADPGFGIMAVVQTMNLQTIMEPQGCLDYIIMSQIEGSETTRKICGSTENQKMFLEEEVQEKPGFVDKTGFLELDYLIQEKTRISKLDGYIANFNISFTPFKECPEEAFPFGNDEVRPCSVVDSFSCIPAEFFCDGVVNCAFPHEYGLDEIDCPPPEVLNSDTFITNEDDGDTIVFYETTTKSPLKRIKIMILSSAYNLVNFGMFATLSLFLIMIAFIKLRRNRVRRFSSVYTISSGSGSCNDCHCDDEEEGDRKNGAENNEKLYLNCDYEYVADYLEGNQIPSYEECLLDGYNRPVYSELSYEYEKPPTYEEVRVHTFRHI